MQEIEVTQLLEPQVTTAAGVTGGYVSVSGIVNVGTRAAKFVLVGGTGTTAGTISGSIQSAADTAGTGLATVATFTGLTSAGGVEEKHGVIPAAHSYVRFLGDVQAGKDMIVGAYMIAQARVSP